MDAAQDILQVWRHAQGARRLKLPWAQKQMVVRIIDHEQDQRGRWRGSDFWRACEDNGMDIRLAEWPMALSRQKHPVSGSEWNPMSELAWMLEPRFYAEACTEPQGLAIIGSHLRVLAEGCEALNQQHGWITVLERDAELDVNSFLRLQWLLRELLLHDPAGRTAYVSLIVSQERQDHVTHIMQQVNQPPLPRSEDFHCKLCDFPLTSPQNPRHQSLMNLGQGARGYCVSTELARFVLAQRVWSWYDVFLHATAVKFKRQHGDNRRLLFLWPPMAKHPVQHSDCARGSDRMLAHLPNAAARVADYITIDFRQQWGCSNRLETIATLLMVCHATNTGLHIRWEAAECCPGDLAELIHLEADQSELSGIPFIQVHKLPGHFRAFCSQSVMPQNKGNFSFQLPVRLFTEAAVTHLASGSNRNPTFQDAGSIDWGAAWRALMPRAHIIGDVENFLYKWGDTWEHVAIHVRRGDWRRREECNAVQQNGEAGLARVKQQYDDADWQILAPK